VVTGKTGFAKQHEILRAVLETSPGFTYDEHALLRMRERRITRQDVWAALHSGRIVGAQTVYGTEERWRIEGRDLDDDPLVVIVRAVQRGDAVILVITAFPPDRR
jgi:hypothetical protein